MPDEANPPSNEKSDEELVQRCRDGDRHAFGILVDETLRQVESGTTSELAELSQLYLMVIDDSLPRIAANTIELEQETPRRIARLLQERQGEAKKIAASTIPAVSDLFTEVANHTDQTATTILMRQPLKDPQPTDQRPFRSVNLLGQVVIFSKGLEHEKAFLQKLQKEGRQVEVINTKSGDKGIAATLEAMKKGVDVIYQAHLSHEGFAGFADFLIRKDGKSLLGDYYYEAWDTKLARSFKPYFVVQLCAYSEMLVPIQEILPINFSAARGVASYSSRIDESRQMFLAILSHDLRNPLSCIRMAADLVSRTKQEPDSVEALSVIESSTEVMLRLISDLIDFSSSGLGRAMPLNRGPVDLEELCRDVVESFRTSHPERLLCFHSNGDVTGTWDAGRIRQVISNLVGNALQHGSPEAAVELSVTSEGSIPEESRVVLRVHNKGTAIPPDVLPTIFNPLVRYATHESARQRKSGSIGLGLYIVREIVVANGGTVEVASTAQEGTTFTVRIPRFLPIETDKRVEMEAAK